MGREAFVTIRPEDIAMSADEPMSAENVLSGQVIDTIYLGNLLDCRVDVDGRELRVQLNHDEAPRLGERVYLTFVVDVCHGLPDDA
ncbi:MAG: hypothetical protein ETSY2_27590 [Candidatus Entotheonella gemina]|uniref:Transport-associated OB type 2 domain-containing protein n=1 Tax=Candidatus Entotheonella gemina TaxID=1429439 RepID=W4M380_9BACT|nr:MAG: hypothetical protein ETSY2_27590 [Candidatus Entotheonella gemina]